MDLISTLTSGLGIDASQAQGLAGGVLGMVKGQVAEHAGAEQAAQMEQAIPEMGGWQQMASSMMGGAGGSDAGGLLGAAAGALGGGATGGLLGAAAGAIGGKSAQQATQLVGLLGNLGIDPKYGAMAAPMILDFLKARLPAGLMDTALQAAPFLTGVVDSGGDDGGDGGITGALSGLLGG